VKQHDWPAENTKLLSPADEDFGAFLERIRRRSRIQILEVVEYLPGYLVGWDRFTYSRLESGRRAPRFEELVPLYQALVTSGVHFKLEERYRFLELARQKIDGKKSRRARPHTETEWKLLQMQLAQFEEDSHEQVEVHDQSLAGHVRISSPRLLTGDVRHLMGREGWLQTMHAYLQTDLPKKLVVVHGPMGIGKSSGFSLLLRWLVDAGKFQVIVFSCPAPGVGVTAEECLDQCLAALLSNLGMVQPEVTRTSPLQQRVETVLAHLAAIEQQTVLLIDNAESMLAADGSLASCWQHFLTAFVHNQHRATIFLATREWPSWSGRDRSYVAETTMPPLPPEIGAIVLQRLGFDKVPDDLLLKVSLKCGGNPLLLELWARIVQKPVISFTWEEEMLAPPPRGNEDDEVLRALERFLAEPRLFNDVDRDIRDLLRQVISTRISTEARRILDVLAVALVPLARPLLHTFCQYPTFILAELRYASLLAQSNRLQLLPLVQEAALHQMALEGRTGEVEQHVIAAYQCWLDTGTFRDEHEKGAVVAELAILLLKHRRLLDAAQLLIHLGWLSFTFGYGLRIARAVVESMKTFDWRSAPDSEAGGLLLDYYVGRFLGKNLDEPAREAAYNRIYDLLSKGQITLQLTTIAHLIHHLVRYHVAHRRFEDAQALLDRAQEQYVEANALDPLTHAVVLAIRAYLYGKWSESPSIPEEEAKRLKEACVEVYGQGIVLLRGGEQPASPVEKSTIRFRLARFLNDSAYYQRALGRLEEARTALEESLAIKRQGFTLSGSLAVSIGEYAQLLAASGRFQDALVQSDLALEKIQKLCDRNHPSARKTRAMLLAERAQILLLLGRLEESKPLFERALPDLNESRRAHLDMVQRGLQRIEVQHSANPDHKLDWQWFKRYQDLVEFDSIGWLAAAGPFTLEERREWDALNGQDSEEALAAKASLITHSRKRELTAALEENREPRLHYPKIPIVDVEWRIQGLSQLRAAIGESEPNVTVRRLYIDTIDEQIATLSHIKAIHRQDSDAFWRYNRLLYAQPTAEEIEIAMRQLAKQIRRGLRRQGAAQVSLSLFHRLQQWHCMGPQDLKLDEQDGNSQEPAPNQRPVSGDHLYSPQVARRFFEDILREYGLDDWCVELDTMSTSARVELDLRTIFLPAEMQVTLGKIRQLLAHEIECHVLRAANGRRSPLALLGSGTARFLDTEEGLALYYAQQVADEVAQLEGRPEREPSWTGTLATGIACGVELSPGIAIPAHTFRSSFHFFESVFLLNALLDGKERGKAAAEAKQKSLTRCLRTYRGVPQLETPGLCSTKDSIYLRGYLKVLRALQQGVDVERLLIGACAVEQLTDLVQLGIETPLISNRRLALRHDLVNRLEYISQEMR
jgi:hypothetical protein